MINYINSELDVIGKYEDEKFEDINLKGLAIKYISLLKQHKDICKYITVDYQKYEEGFDEIYNERSKIISQMVTDYDMTVSDKYQSTLNDFLENSNLVKESESNQEAIENMVNVVTFEVSDDQGDGWKTYQGILENTTGLNFKTISLNINLLDADGIIVETTFDQISSFTDGAKARIEFTTDKEFVSTQIMVDWWD